MFQLKSRANLSTSETNPHGGNAMQCCVLLCFVFANACAVEQTARKHEGSPSIKEVLDLFFVGSVEN